MWCEAEMREIEAPVRPARRVWDTGAGALRREIRQCNAEAGAELPRQLTRGGTAIYQAAGSAHGNFLPASYRRICAHPEWVRRLGRAHTSKRQGRLLDARSDSPRAQPWRELDSANSSDALLMNVFCYPRVLAGERLPALLGVERGAEPVFGYRPRVPLLRGREDCTEVDMRLGGLMVESKLTEAVFPPAPLRKVERYRDFDAVFDRGLLVREGEVSSYQMVRGVLAAAALGESYCLICDARRPEMLAAWEEVIQAVRSFALRSRLKVVTWQEIAGAVPGTVRSWLEQRYGIVGGALR